jgi:hypothetical protein
VALKEDQIKRIETQMVQQTSSSEEKETTLQVMSDEKLNLEQQVSQLSFDVVKAHKIEKDLRDQVETINANIQKEKVVSKEKQGRIVILEDQVKVL